MAYLQVNSSQDRTLDFEGYLETWDGDMWEVLKQMQINESTWIDISFSNFTFSNDGDGKIVIGGVDISKEELKQVIDYIHSRGGHVKMSFGGASYPLFTHLNSEADEQALAQQIADAVKEYNLDGVDLDVEDKGDMSLLAKLIHDLRIDLGPDKTISLTPMGQDWALGDFLKSVQDDVDYFNFMEYNIWVDPSMSYAEQIKWDIDFYINNWGLSPEKIHLGLMPGYDDMGHYLSESDAKDLAAWAKERGLTGVMIWSLDRDFHGLEGSGSFAYSHDITDMIQSGAQTKRVEPQAFTETVSANRSELRSILRQLAGSQ